MGQDGSFWEKPLQVFSRPDECQFRSGLETQGQTGNRRVRRGECGGNVDEKPQGYRQRKHRGQKRLLRRNFVFLRRKQSPGSQSHHQNNAQKGGGEESSYGKENRFFKGRSEEEHAENEKNRRPKGGGEENDRKEENRSERRSEEEHAENAENRSQGGSKENL